MAAACSSALAAAAGSASFAPALDSSRPRAPMACTSWRQQLPARAARAARGAVSPRNVAMQDSAAGMGEEDSEPPARTYPKGLQRYESMIVVRPDISEEERNNLTERYEEFMVAGGALDVEMFNRGMQPLAYDIKTKNMAGAKTCYMDGIYLLFTYITKPASQVALQQRFNKDDDVIRSTTFKLRI